MGHNRPFLLAATSTAISRTFWIVACSNSCVISTNSENSCTSTHKGIPNLAKKYYIFKIRTYSYRSKRRYMHYFCCHFGFHITVQQSMLSMLTVRAQYLRPTIIQTKHKLELSLGCEEIIVEASTTSMLLHLRFRLHDSPRNKEDRDSLL